MEFLREDEFKEVAGAKSYHDLARVALVVLHRLSDDHKKSVVMVCGPLTTGGAFLKRGHSQSEAELVNRAELKKVIGFLAKKSVIFSQLPFLDRAEDLRSESIHGRRSLPWNSLFPRNWEKRRDAFSEDRLRQEFHLALLQSGFITTIYFLHGWQNSQGSRWYYYHAKNLGIEIRHAFLVKKQKSVV